MGDWTDWISPGAAFISLCFAIPFAVMKKFPAIRAVLFTIAAFGTLRTSGKVADALSGAGGHVANWGEDLTTKWFNDQFGALLPAGLALSLAVAFYLDLMPNRKPWHGAPTQPSNRTTIIGITFAVFAMLTPGAFAALGNASGVA